MLTETNLEAVIHSVIYEKFNQPTYVKYTCEHSVSWGQEEGS